MKEKTKRVLSMAYVLLTIALVVILGAVSGNARSAWNALLGLKLQWVVAMFGCLVCFVSARGFALVFFCGKQGLKLRWADAWRIATLGQYYSGITPAATAGQPMQIYELSKCGIPIGVGSSAIIVKTLCFQVALMGVGVGLWCYHAQAVYEQLKGVMWLIVFGFGVNLLISLLLLVLMLRRSLVAWLVDRMVRLGTRLRWIREPVQFAGRAQAQLAEFQRVLRLLVRRPVILAGTLSLAVVQVFAYMGTIYFLYRSFGLQTHSAWFLITIQTLLYIAVALMPTPGASGAQEGGFYLFFRGIFPEGSMLAALLTWRFFTYYLVIIVGAGLVIHSTLRNRRR